jgi:Cu(I)/Ag(I) efflux system membrane fusion protein
MHPEIIREQPGSCPICGMELIKKLDVNKGGGGQGVAQPQPPEQSGKVSLTSTQRVMADVATMEARPEILSKEINAAGIVQYDQSRQAKVTTWIAGRIDRLNINTVGAFVGKDRAVAEIYSPDIVATQQEYLLALRSRNQMKSQSNSTLFDNGEGMVASARQRLKLFGVRESQIAALERSGQPQMKLTIYTPLSGIVIEKMVQVGQYVNAGEVLFSIADLSKVWVELEVYESEFPNIHPGQQVEIRSQSYPGQPFNGKITFIYPFLDPKTRTLRARVEMANPDLKLKPDMFVNAVIKVPLNPAIVLPLTAVIDTGKRQVVWVESSPGTFEPHDVVLGQKSGDKVQILSGISSGDKVAVSGGYLIDSESQLKGGGRENMPVKKIDAEKPSAPATRGNAPPAR